MTLLVRTLPPRPGSRLLLVAIATVMAAFAVGCAGTRAQPPAAHRDPPVIWRDPAAIAGVVGLHSPRAPFRFVAEDLDGDSPKFDVVDAEGMRWRVKLGPEAHTEPAAATILAAAGYFVDDIHYVRRVRIAGVDRLQRGREFVDADGSVIEAAFEARPTNIKRGPRWSWESNPFVGTRRLDGLRVMMVLINNYDARPENNRILRVLRADGSQEERYIVSDLGASFGRCGGLGGRRTKGNVSDYASSPFIGNVQDGYVQFAYSTTPEAWGRLLYVLNPLYVRGQVAKQRQMRRVPIGAAGWIAHTLATISDDTLAGAFERGGYDIPTTRQYVSILRQRIAQLSRCVSVGCPGAPARNQPSLHLLPGDDY